MLAERCGPCRLHIQCGNGLAREVAVESDDPRFGRTCHPGEKQGILDTRRAAHGGHGDLETTQFGEQFSQLVVVVDRLVVPGKSVGEVRRVVTSKIGAISQCTVQQVVPSRKVIWAPSASSRVEVQPEGLHQVGCRGVRMTVKVVVAQPT